MAVKIIPAVLGSTVTSLRRRLRRAEQFSSTIHLDVMDGQFVASRTIPAARMKELRPGASVDLHFMVRRPEAWLPLIGAWHVRRAIIHVELGTRLRMLIALFRSNRIRIDLALNPRTPVSRLRPWIRFIHGLQVMGVQPGRYGATFIPSTPRRVARLRHSFPRLPISVDGGVTPTVIPELVTAGADRLIVGSYLQQAAHPDQAWRLLHQSLTGR